MHARTDLSVDGQFEAELLALVLVAAAGQPRIHDLGRRDLGRSRSAFVRSRRNNNGHGQVELYLFVVHEAQWRMQNAQLQRNEQG
jgi:hypothetical protein